MKRFVIRNYGVSIQSFYDGMNVTLARDCVIETDNEGMANHMKPLQNIEVTDRGVDVHENALQEVDKQFNHDDKKPTASLAEQDEPPVDVNEEDVGKLPDIESVDDDAEEISYDDMKVLELKEIAKDRDVEVKGMNKAEIIKALTDFDKAGRPKIEEQREN